MRGSDRSILRQQPLHINLLRLLIVLMGVVTTTLGSLRGEIMTTASLSSIEVARVLKGKNKKTTVSEKPNIIFILADDLGYNSLNEDVAPFLSSMREQGVNIPMYYSQELCTPARAALLTGRYPLSLGMQFGAVSESTDAALNLEETTIAEVLQGNGYTTYMFGKWHLGNASPRHLPTARGFDYYMGFLAGQTDYWSKRCPEHPNTKDFLFSTSECYYMYDDEDLNHYSTFLYRDKAVGVINNHDFASSPMFMYMSFQAVHDPWTDLDGSGNPGVKFPNGIPQSYFSANTGVYDYIQSSYPGANVRQYFMALSLMDTAVSSMYTAIEDRGVLDNTYFIFASDNGGCPTSGGRNYPLRGGKSTLFEGGSRVEAFVYSNLLDSGRRGSEHSGLFHVSDWFPTIVDMAGIEDYESALALDGYSQYSSITSGKDSPRDYVLYNFYMNIYGKQLDFFNNAGGAIRNAKYKLLHTYTNENEEWYPNEGVFADDSLTADVALINSMETYNVFCSSPTATQFSYFLFDLESDPYETTNLYDTSEEMMQVQADLWKQMQKYSKKSRQQVEGTTNLESYTTWAYNGDYITPWVKDEHLAYGFADDGETVGENADGLKMRKYPANCGYYSAAKAAGAFGEVVEETNELLNPAVVVKALADRSTVIDRWTWSVNDILVFTTLIVFFLVIITCTAMWFTRPMGKEAAPPQRGTTRPSTDLLARSSVTRSLGRGSFHDTLTNPTPMPALPGRPPSKRPSKTTPPGSKRVSKRNSKDVERGMIDSSLAPTEAAFLLGEQQPAVAPAVITQGDTALAQTLLSVLAQGMTMTVYNENGAKQAHVTLEGGSILHWRTLKMFAKRNKNLNLRDVLFVNSGKQTNKFHLPTSRAAVEENCFSLVTSKDTLDFEVSSKVERDALAQGFTILLTRFREQRAPEQVAWNPNSI